MLEHGFKFILYRSQYKSDIYDVTLDVTLNGTEMSVLAILRQKPDSSRNEIADKISKLSGQCRERWIRCGKKDISNGLVRNGTQDGKC